MGYNNGSPKKKIYHAKQLHEDIRKHPNKPSFNGAILRPWKGKNSLWGEIIKIKAEKQNRSEK